MIKPNLSLEFKKIIDLDSSKEILDVLLSSPQLEENLGKILEAAPSKNKTEKLNPLRNYFDHLKESLGRSPTRRQFMEKIDPKLKRHLTTNYGGYYKKFLSDERIYLKDDLDLKDSLCDEYFEKCINEGERITRQQLDEYGEYRIEDYEDIWGSFEKFERRMGKDHTGNSILNNVLENYDEKRKIRDQEFEEISKDLANLKQKLGQNYNHFDTIWQHGGIRIFRYIIQLKISHLKYLNNYHGEYAGECLHIISDLFKLKKILQTTPSSMQFTDLTGTETTADFMKVFNSNYDKLLEIIKLKQVEKTDPEHDKKMKNLVLEKMQSFCKNNGKEKALIYIDKRLDPNDELSILIHAYYPNKKELEKLLYPG